MKKNPLWLNLTLGIAFLVFTAFVGIRIVWLPFHWVGTGLRWLSLSGTAGNLFSIVLFGLLGLVPMLAALRKKWQPENWLLPASCGVLYYILYYGVNPGLRTQVLHGEVGDLILAGCFWSLLIGWAIIRFIRNIANMDTPRIFRILRMFLRLCAGILVWAGIALGLYSLLGDLRLLKEQNNLPGLNLLPTQIIMSLSYIVTALEYCLDAAVLTFGTGFLREVEKEPYSEGSCAAVEKLSLWCRRTLIIIILSHTGLNIIKLFLAERLLVVNTAFSLPLLSIAINLCVLGLSRLLDRGRAIKEDNDLII